MKDFIDKVLNEILSGADGAKYLAVLILGYPVMYAWLLFKARNRNADPKTGDITKFNLWYSIKHNAGVVIYTSIFLNVSALWVTANFPTYKAITLGIVMGIMSTVLGVIFEKIHNAIFKKVGAEIDKI